MISSCFFDAVFVIFWGVRCPGPLFFAHGRGHSHSQRLNWIRFHAVRIPLARDGDQTDPRRLASERDPFQWAFWEACDHRWTTIWSPLRHRRPGATSPVRHVAEFKVWTAARCTTAGRRSWNTSPTSPGHFLVTAAWALHWAVCPVVIFVYTRNTDQS
ncbi:unnamed protein product [Durusdinium trenchii]|uniref:Secreted protein n=1 Tax=Durusdinium trenchii TaxID=1381693 RepID=A0ABP0NE56_9DINO